MLSPFRMSFIFFQSDPHFPPAPSGRVTKQTAQELILHLEGIFFTVLWGHGPPRSLLPVRTAGPPMPLGSSGHGWLYTQ